MSEAGAWASTKGKDSVELTAWDVILLGWPGERKSFGPRPDAALCADLSFADAFSGDGVRTPVLNVAEVGVLTSSIDSIRFSTVELLERGTGRLTAVAEEK
jgi:hypothetical protein